MPLLYSKDTMSLSWAPPSPPQAEAQCAWLDEQGLVDGVVTDDNDAFLFGCTHVYRHIFDNKR